MPRRFSNSMNASRSSPSSPAALPAVILRCAKRAKIASFLRCSASSTLSAASSATLTWISSLMAAFIVPLYRGLVAPFAPGLMASPLKQALQTIGESPLSARPPDLELLQGSNFPQFDQESDSEPESGPRSNPGPAHRIPPAHRPGRLLSCEPQPRPRLERLPRLRSLRPRSFVPPRPILLRFPCLLPQIGRASCRERV